MVLLQTFIRKYLKTLSETNCNSTRIALFALIVSEMDNKIGTSKKHLNVIILTNQMKIAFS